MPVIDMGAVPIRTSSIYPAPFAAMMAGRSSQRLAQAGGLTQFGVNLVRLEPGALSSLRHWHLHEDEFVMVTSGECVLVQDAGETVMRAGDCAAFPANVPDGHHFINRSDQVATFLVVTYFGLEDHSSVVITGMQFEYTTMPDNVIHSSEPLAISNGSRFEVSYTSHTFTSLTRGNAWAWYIFDAVSSITVSAESATPSGSRRVDPDTAKANAMP